jgi:uncharacterized Fe-S cluster-containing MiaB family protein
MELALLDAGKELNVTIKLHIESHCEDFLLYNTQDEKYARELELLRNLNTHIIFGLESSDEYARNILYNKHLKLSDFECAVSKAKNAGLTPGAFVFAGLFSYNDKQTHIDVISTIDYLIDMHVFPVLMFQNDQQYTITDILLKKGLITLLEPFSLAWIVVDALERISEANQYWLIADPIGGPPEPDYHIFKTKNESFDSCAYEIYEALVDLRKTRNIQTFVSAFEKLKTNQSWERYLNFYELLPTGTSLTRKKTNELLVECRRYLSKYLETVEVSI